MEILLNVHQDNHCLSQSMGLHRIFLKISVHLIPGSSQGTHNSAAETWRGSAYISTQEYA